MFDFVPKFVVVRKVDAREVDDIDVMFTWVLDAPAFIHSLQNKFVQNEFSVTVDGNTISWGLSLPRIQFNVANCTYNWIAIG